MQIMITHSGLARTRVLSLSRAQLIAAFLGWVVLLLLLSGAVYHFIFLKAAREGWPVVSQLVKLVIRDEMAQQERFMRENLDAMARKVGEMQARVVHLEAMEDRVSGLAGVKSDDLKVMRGPAMAASAQPAAGPAAASAPAALAKNPVPNQKINPAPSPGAGPAASPAAVRSAPAPAFGSGGPYLPLDHPSLSELHSALDNLEERVDHHGDLLTLAESRLLESRLRALMVPNSKPIDVQTGSGFGFRADPFTGRPALHTGLDFAADVGTPILAAAGGVVLSTDVHPQYGLLLELDHGNGLVTRYAHTSRILVKPGDIVKRGQPIARVGNSGRSTGPHLHFEVVVDGVPHDPAKFLSAGASGQPQPALAAAVKRP